MSLTAWIAKDLDLTENEAIELYDQREELAKLVNSTRWLRAVSLRRFNFHLESICVIEERPAEYLAYRRGRAQEALELPNTLKSLHEALLSSCDEYRKYLKEQQEEAASGSA